RSTSGASTTTAPASNSSSSNSKGLCSRQHSRHFFANETYFHLLLLAYNLVNWFKRLCLPDHLQNATLQTLRHRILLMPAQLRRTDNRPRLVLPASDRREAAWKHALHQINKLKLCNHVFTPDSGLILFCEFSL